MDNEKAVKVGADMLPRLNVISRAWRFTHSLDRFD